MKSPVKVVASPGKSGGVRSALNFDDTGIVSIYPFSVFVDN
jgi:hypothetical protein